MAGFSQKNIEQVQRNGKPKESKVVVKYITNAGRDGVGGEDTYNVVLSPNNMTFTAGAYYAQAQTHYINIFAYRGATQINAYVNDASISTGNVTGLTASVQSGTNGTNHTVVVVNVANTLSTDSGQITIPVQYNVSSTDSSTEIDSSEWAAGEPIATFNAIFSWTLGKSGESLYNLDLSNENASINCDASGNVVDGAVKPTCTATLYYGSHNASEYHNNVSYVIDPSVQGVSINSSTGVITFDSSFNFYPDDTVHTTLEITVKAKVGAQVRGTKIMTISKSIPGANGTNGQPGATPVIGSNGNWWINGVDTGVQAEGQNGSPGTPGAPGATPEIGSNGNWWINGVDTGVQAEGQNGSTPVIGNNGNWFINGVDTGIKAEGQDGSPGAPGNTPYIQDGYWYIAGVNTNIKAEGQDAVSYWLEFSANQIKVDASNNVIPSDLIVSGWMQVGGNAPEPLPVPDEDEVSLYRLEMYINGDPEQGYDMAFDTSISVSNYRNFDYLQFKLIDDTNLVSLDTETVPILKDGKNGSDGTDGRNGAVVRGPILWDSSTDVNSSVLVRRFCSGAQDSSAHPEDAQYIDIILHDSHHYKCTTSYDQSTNTTLWNDVSLNWLQADGEYDFIATHVLLAENASIQFLTNNELYLTDADGSVSGGARAASSGNDIMFWAGSENPDSSANFIVDYQGNLIANSGTFSGFIKIPYKSIGELSKESRYNGYGFMAGDYTNLRVYNQDSSVTGAGCYITVRDSSTSSTTRTINSSVLYLPEPTEDRVGMTYKILLPSVDYYRNSDLTPWLCIAVASQTSTDTSGKIEDSYHIAGPSRGVSIVAVYKGYIELTCLPVTKLGVNCSWYITNCSGPVDLYGPFKPTGGLLINDLYDISCSNVTTYAKSRSSSIVNRIVSDTTLSHTDSNTLYVEI